MRHLLIAGVACSLAIALGCGGPFKEPTGKTEGPKVAKHDDHAHQPSAHGGLIVPLGSDKYHAEAVFEAGGTLRLYTLGQDESVVKEIDEQTLDGHIKPAGGALWTAIALKPTPQPGDAKGKTSQFAGRVPAELIGKHLIVKFNAIRIGKERYRIAFESGAHGDAEPHAEDHAAMPAKVPASDEEKLYLTPGGLYTEADIRANGRVIASEKFKGLKANHDAKPVPGDKLCPVSMTKASPQFSWVIGGKTYEFCCPPCVDEFVALAKEKPGDVKPPEFYVQK